MFIKKTIIMRLILSLIFLSLSFQINAQKVEGSFKSPKILKTENGYIVCGSEKGVVELVQFDKDLNQINTLRQEVHKKTKVVVNFTQIGRDKMIVETKNECILINLDEFKVIETGPNELLKFYGREDKNNYVPYITNSMVAGVKSQIKYGDNLIELIQENSKLILPGKRGAVEVLGNGSDNFTGGTEIRSSIYNNNINSTYTLEWSQKLKHGVIIDMEWYVSDNGLYLQVSEQLNEQYKTFIYKIDPSRQEIFYKEELLLENAYISHMSEDKLGNLIVFGITIDKSGETKWFTYKMDEMGDVFDKKEFDIEQSFPTEGIKNNVDFTNLFCIRSSKFDDIGNMNLIAEHIRLYTKTVSYPETGKSVKMLICQTYGYTHFQVSPDWNLSGIDHYSRFYSDKTFPNGHENILIHDHVKTRYPDIYTVVKGYDSAMLSEGTSSIESVLYYEDETEDCAIVYSQHKESSELTNYYCLFVSGKNKGKEVLLSENMKSSDVIKYSLDDLGRIIETRSNPKEYSIRIIKV